MMLLMRSSRPSGELAAGCSVGRSCCWGSWPVAAALASFLGTGPLSGGAMGWLLPSILLGSPLGLAGSALALCCSWVGAAWSGSRPSGLCCPEKWVWRPTWSPWAWRFWAGCATPLTCCLSGCHGGRPGGGPASQCAQASAVRGEPDCMPSSRGGRQLARLWRFQACFRIGSVCQAFPSRSPHTAR